MMNYSTNKGASNQCVIDSNLFVGYFYRHDPFHTQAIKLFTALEKWQKQFNWLVLSEVASVMLLRSKNQELTNEVVNTLTSPLAKDLFIQALTPELKKTTLSIFANQVSSKLSLPDCSLIAQARLSNCQTIVTLDKDLRREFRHEFEFLPKLVRI